jgi:hypothetical protein
MRQSDATTRALPCRPAGFRARPLRLHVDLSPVRTSQDAELARLLAAGARPADVGQRGDEGWRMLADPEGNEFCLPRRPLVT